MGCSVDAPKHTRILICLQLSLLAVALCWSSLLRARDPWIEDSFGDFSDGKLDGAGQNIFVSSKGEIRTIHRFDLNEDGYIDLVFNSTHDRYSSIPATMAWKTSGGSVEFSHLGIDGSRQTVVADLNGDGFLDLAFCPNAGGVQHGRRFITIVWGGADGWPEHRANGVLPVHHALAMVVADLNVDGWPDLVSLNGSAWLPGQPAGKIVRIYWGSSGGFLLTRVLDIGVPEAIAIASGQLDDDGALDVAVLTSKSKIHILHSLKQESPPTEIKSREIDLPNANSSCIAVSDIDGNGIHDFVLGSSEPSVLVVRGSAEKKWLSATTYPAVQASHVAVGDLDGDHLNDLVLTDFSVLRAAGGEAGGVAGTRTTNVHILWGSTDGFSRTNGLELPANHAMATAIGDLDSDGKPELAIAIHQGESTLNANSMIYWNRGSRQFDRRGDTLPTTGASDVAILPAHQSHAARAVFSNSAGGTIGEAIPLQVYWGGPKGFSTENVWNIPFACGYESSAADLNGDGFVDLVELNSGHAGEISHRDPNLGVNIFWGSAGGFDTQKNRTVLREYNLGTSNIADLNRDGHLDLILGQFSAGPEQGSAEVIVYYGSAEGFSRQRRVGIESPGRSISSVVADWNGDQWLDIAVNSFDRDAVRILWGSENGFRKENQQQLAIHSPIDVETADLNRDGFLDLVVGAYQDRKTSYHDVGSTIFWGSKSGFQNWNAQWLPGHTPIGHCIADFDSDGHLDLFSPHYHGDLTRESLPAYLYWGSAKGISPYRKTRLICDSSDDALAADFDRDGRMDLAVVCHSQNHQHGTVSKVFYNDGQRFSNPRITELPTTGPHWMWQQDMGHIATRAWRQTYESSVHSYGQPSKVGTLVAQKRDSPGTSIKFAVRSAPGAAALEKRPWREIVEGVPFQLEDQDRTLQYRTTFTSDNGDRFAVLERVEVRFE